MEQARKTLIIGGAVLSFIDGLIMFILTFVFFDAASKVLNGQDAFIKGMSSDAISTVAIAFLMVSLFSLALGAVCIFSFKFKNLIMYIAIIVLSVISATLGPAMVGAIFGLVLLKKPPVQQEA